MKTSFVSPFNKIAKFNVNFHPFCLWFSSISYLGFNALNYNKIIRWFIAKDHYDYLGISAFYITGWCLSLIIFLLIAHPRTAKFMAILLTILSTVTVYFIIKYDVAIDRTMIMNAFYTDKHEVYSLLSFQMVPYILFLGILPCMLITTLNINFPKKYFIKSLKIILILLLVSVACIYAKYNSIHRAANLSNKYIIYTIVPINYLRAIGSAIQHELKPYFTQRAQQVQISGTITKQDDLVVVLAVGESSRQKSFSLYGYERNTNPLLSGIKDLHALNGKARLGSTLYAMPEILVKDNVPLTAVTHKLGIETACYANYSLYDNCIVPGQTMVSNCKYGKDTCYDEDVIPLLEANLKSYKAGYRFIVLHLGGGSHGPSYHERYPQDFQVFQPICKDADVTNKCTPQELFNSFDNTILYVDYVVSNVIKKLDASSVPYVFIYVSDHGESLLEEGRIFHGMPPGVSLPPEQAKVPLLVKASVPVNIKKRTEYPQPEIFDTVLDLFSIETAVANKEKSFIGRR